MIKQQQQQIYNSKISFKLERCSTLKLFNKLFSKCIEKGTSTASGLLRATLAAKVLKVVVSSDFWRVLRHPCAGGAVNGLVTTNGKIN